MPPDSPEPDSATDDQTMLVTWLSTHDAPCPACQYNLRNLTAPRCPECGRPLSLSVAVVEPYLRTWIATAVSLCAIAGLGVACLIGLLGSKIRSGSFDLPPQTGGRILIFYYIATVPTAAASFLFRRPFVRLNRPAQRVILITSIAMAFTGFAGLLYAMLQ